MSKLALFLFLCFIAYAHCVFKSVCYEKPSACVLKANRLSDFETEQNIFNARCKALEDYIERHEIDDWEIKVRYEKYKEYHWDRVEIMDKELEKLEAECDLENGDKRTKRGADYKAIYDKCWNDYWATHGYRHQTTYVRQKCLDKADRETAAAS